MLQIAKDFINQCLILDPAARPTALQALEHPWLSTESKTDLLPTVRKGFNAKRQWGKGKQALLFSLVHVFTTDLNPIRCLLAINAVRGVSRMGSLALDKKSEENNDGKTDSEVNGTNLTEEQQKKLMDTLAKLKAS